uniref:tRNA pseudouridine synthase n=1 Tax=Cacopsylla melanoneura TaxID=428564 RepID=A0A8D8R0L0_9HEMI
MSYYKQLFKLTPIKKRYLLQFGYIGTDFSGVQRQIPYGINLESDIFTVQGLLENGLSRLKPLNEPRIHTSSRTDAGVHAIRSTAHVDLEFYYEHQHNPYNICKRINHFFLKANLDIRLQNVVQVPDNFSARFNAIWRKYVYRVAVIRDNKYHYSSHNFFIPMTEHDRCHFLLDHPFVDMDAARECAKMVVGVKNFASFMSRYGTDRDETVNPTRTLHSFDITPSKSFFDTEWDKQFYYWDFTCTGRAFLYKQVRKLVTAMIQVAQKRFTVEEFAWMLNNPSTDNWPSHMKLVPPYGLFLMDIGYREEDLRVPKDNIRYSLVLESMQSDNKLEVIKILRELHGSCTILQARDMMKNLPVVVRSDLVERDARFYQELFESKQCMTRLEKIVLPSDDTETNKPVHDSDSLSSSNDSEDNKNSQVNNDEKVKTTN